MANTKYSPDWPDIARDLCLSRGFTDDQLAKHFEVSVRSLHRYKKEFPEFGDAIREAKDEFDTTHVENAILRRALGMTVTETKTTNGDSATEVVTVKDIPPDTTACIYWLKNRNPARWRDKQEIEHDIQKVSIVDLTGENADSD